MAKYGDKKDFTYTGKNGEKHEFVLQHIGLAAADEMLDEIRNDGGKTSIKAYRTKMFEHVISLKNGDQVDYAYFEQFEDGGKMMKAVTEAAQEFIFPKA